MSITKYGSICIGMIQHHGNTFHIKNKVLYIIYCTLNIFLCSTATVPRPAQESGTSVLSYQDHPPQKTRAQEGRAQLHVLRLLPAVQVGEGGRSHLLHPPPRRLRHWPTGSRSNGALSRNGVGTTERQVHQGPRRREWGEEEREEEERGGGGDDGNAAAERATREKWNSRRQRPRATDQ